MTSKHTPGPYLFRHDYGTRYIIISDSVQEAVGVAYGKANAVFFTAAPQLLVALDRAVQDIDSGWAEDAEERFPWLIDARAAIKDAKGE